MKANHLARKNIKKPSASRGLRMPIKLPCLRQSGKYSRQWLKSVDTSPLNLLASCCGAGCGCAYLYDVQFSNATSSIPVTGLDLKLWAGLYINPNEELIGSGGCENSCSPWIQLDITFGAIFVNTAYTSPYLNDAGWHNCGAATGVYDTYSMCYWVDCSLGGFVACGSDNFDVGSSNCGATLDPGDFPDGTFYPINTQFIDISVEAYGTAGNWSDSVECYPSGYGKIDLC